MRITTALSIHSKLSKPLFSFCHFLSLLIFVDRVSDDENRISRKEMLFMDSLNRDNFFWLLDKEAVFDICYSMLRTVSYKESSSYNLVDDNTVANRCISQGSIYI
eukprot:Lithocolla_globosa_v1_NODE_460_length_3991_cov_36.476372.p3 type:complete len:105 gc:universal NODE_460_length_3991_cov_36.476372:3322-3636(+)